MTVTGDGDAEREEMRDRKSSKMMIIVSFIGPSRLGFGLDRN